MSVQQTCVASLFSLIIFHVRHTHTNIHPIQPKSGSVLATAENTFKVAVSTNLHTKELTFVLQCYPMENWYQMYSIQKHDLKRAGTKQRRTELHHDQVYSLSV